MRQKANSYRPSVFLMKLFCFSLITDRAKSTNFPVVFCSTERMARRASLSSPLSVNTSKSIGRAAGSGERNRSYSACPKRTCIRIRDLPHSAGSMPAICCQNALPLRYKDRLRLRKELQDGHTDEIRFPGRY